MLVGDSGVGVAVYREVIATPTRKQPAVFTKRRPSQKELELSKRTEDKRLRDMTKSFWLPEHLTGSGSDMDTWPEPLRLFEYRLTGGGYRSPDPRTTVSDLRKFYGEDKVLMEFANFIEAAQEDDPGVTFAAEYKIVRIPRSTDGSFRIL